MVPDSRFVAVNQIVIDLTGVQIVTGQICVHIADLELLMVSTVPRHRILLNALFTYSMDIRPPAASNEPYLKSIKNTENISSSFGNKKKV